MGSVILIVISLVVISLFYYVDSKRHNELMAKTVISIHSNERYMIREKAKLISREYPMLSKAALSFANTDLQFTSKESIKSAKPLPKDAKEKLDMEIQRIIGKEDNSAVEVAHWYMMACVIVQSSMSKESLAEISDKSRMLSKNQYNKVTSEDLCIA